MKSLIRGLSDVAQLWSTLDTYPLRDDAVRSTLSAPNHFTSEAIMYAIDQQMNAINEATIIHWLNDRVPNCKHQVGVINAGNIPLVGLQDLLAVILCGHAYMGVLSKKSPYLIPAFCETINQQGFDLDVRFVEMDEIWKQAESLIATGSDASIAQIQGIAKSHGILREKSLFRSNRFGIAILDGDESEDEWSDLALDILLHEGMGCRNVALIFAPTDLEPDRCLHHLAQTRAVFPAHPTTSGRLAIQQAYLDATNQPHAYGEGLEFLLSKGAAEPQSPGHVRWVEYQSLDEVIAIINGLINQIQCILASPTATRTLPKDWNVEPLGSTQTPELSWKPDGKDTIDFLCNL